MKKIITLLCAAAFIPSSAIIVSAESETITNPKEVYSILAPFIEENYADEAMVIYTEEGDDPEYEPESVYVRIYQTSIGVPDSYADELAHKIRDFMNKSNIDSSVRIWIDASARAERAKKGDINNDGIVDVSDLTELSLVLVDDIGLNAIQYGAADVDRDGAVKLTDLATLKQYLSKQIESLGILSEEGEQSETSQPVPTVTPLPSIPDKGARPEVWPVNREENNPFDIATLRGNTYSKRCIFSFEESQIEEKSVLPFFYEDVETSSGGVAVAKVVKDISSEEMFLLKCGTEEGKYFVFLNNSLSDERTKEIYEELGITDYTNPIDADIPEIPQPVPTVTPFK